MHDLIRDWRRWTRAERVASVVIAIALLIGAFTLTAMDLRANGAGQGAGTSEIPS